MAAAAGEGETRWDRASAHARGILEASGPGTEFLILDTGGQRGGRSFDDRRAALEAVAAGLMVTDPALNDTLRVQSPPSTLPLPEPLTRREQEVLFLLAEGLTNQAIGSRLGISANTAKFHVQALHAKLGVSSRTEAVVQATRRGLLTL